MVSAALVRIEPRVHELCVARANLVRDRTAAELDRYAVKGKHSGGFLVWDVTKPEQRQEILAALAPAFDRRDRIDFLKSVRSTPGRSRMRRRSRRPT
jgi:hypothetical protein